MIDFAPRLTFIRACAENPSAHLIRRDIFKQSRSAALAEWRQLAV
jgi:hypothetical protein